MKKRNIYTVMMVLLVTLATETTFAYWNQRLEIKGTVLAKRVLTFDRLDLTLSAEEELEAKDSEQIQIEESSDTVSGAAIKIEEETDDSFLGTKTSDTTLIIGEENTDEGYERGDDSAFGE